MNKLTAGSLFVAGAIAGASIPSAQGVTFTPPVDMTQVQRLELSYLPCDIGEPDAGCVPGIKVVIDACALSAEKPDLKECGREAFTVPVTAPGLPELYADAIGRWKKARGY